MAITKPVYGTCMSLTSSVPQGSVIGWMLFWLYTSDLLRLFECHNLCPHLYADDTQIYGSSRPAAVSHFHQQTSVYDVAYCQAEKNDLNQRST